MTLTCERYGRQGDNGLRSGSDVPQIQDKRAWGVKGRNRGGLELRVFKAGLCFAAGMLGVQPAAASETIVYTYDARGRLVGVGHTGSINNGIVSTISYDKADNRTNYATTGAQVILKQSFENGMPTLTQKNDGGWTYPSLVTTAPLHGGAAARLGQVGSHVFSVNSPSFVASQSVVTVSLYIRDSGVVNASLTGWSGSNDDHAAPVIAGVYDVTSADWTLDAFETVPFQFPANGGTWSRYVRTVSGLQVGHTYAVTVFVEPYYANRATDIDAVQVEYGSAATPY